MHVHYERYPEMVIRDDWNDTGWWVNQVGFFVSRSAA